MVEPVSERVTTAVLNSLKNDGEAADDNGFAMPVLHNRLADMGVEVSRQYLTTALRGMEERGLIKRDINSKRTFSIALVDPDMEVPELLESARAAPNNLANKNKGKSLDRILVEIERLPVAERLMLVGMIVDTSAQEIDETYANLRQVLSIVGK